MCGICGTFNFSSEQPVDIGDLKRMCDVMAHRGPDDEGFFAEANIGLGMRRLSIIDLSTGHQPISNEDGTVWIVFNGEIYNHLILRKELQGKGHKFSTNTDTEAIVHAYEEYGEDCVNKLRGMFAFAIWDRIKKKLFLARDRIGIKPLYYYLDDKRIIFGSELKVILQCPGIPKDLDFEALDNFLTFEYIPAPLTIFKKIKKLPQAHTLSVENGKISMNEYWKLNFKEVKRTEEETCEGLYEILKEAVKMRLMSDVPLGAFLSGGIDSSTVVGLMSEVMDRPVKTFSIGFDDPSYNELNYARTVAKHFGTDHTELVIKPDIIDWVNRLIKYLDEPFGDFSIFPTFLVSELARKHVTVTLSGDGGDELFAGYEYYIADKIASYYRKLPGVLRKKLIPSIVGSIPPSSQKKGPVNMIKRFVEGTQHPERLRHFRWAKFFSEEEKALLYSEDVKMELDGIDTYLAFTKHFSESNGADYLGKELFADIKTYLCDDILVKVDRMSMANSLEARVPFLDHKFVEFVATIPSGMKLNSLRSKYILKKSMSRILPREILYRDKQGFSIPIKNWLKNELRPLMEEALSPERVKKEGFFNPSYIDMIKTEHLNGVENHSHRLWALMVFEIWQDLYLKN
jgi:asparagine synthase (glutamine-hydrolysing)